MKKFLALSVIVLSIVMLSASCGSSKGGHCDAYSSLDNTENTDLASK